MKNTKKTLYSLYAAGVVAGASMLSGCTTTRTVYVYPDGRQIYVPEQNSTNNSHFDENTAAGIGQILSGILMGIGQAL